MDIPIVVEVVVNVVAMGAGAFFGGVTEIPGLLRQLADAEKEAEEAEEETKEEG